MDINLVQEELMKRYLYLYDNKELILALCINYGIRENYYKELIKNKNELKKIAEEKFSCLSGIAQQYLFYWKREMGG